MARTASACGHLGVRLLLSLVALWGRPCQAQVTSGAEPPPPYVYVGHSDESESFDMILGLTAAAGVDSRSQERFVGGTGIKLGGGCCVTGKHPLERALTVTLDLGYDRRRSRSGISGELSVMIPVARFPNPGTNASKKFIRVYAEPGAGVRAGGGGSLYYSGKAMIALMSNAQISTFAGCPIVEVQRRFALSVPLRGDTRVIIGFMYPLCKHCGFD